MKAKPLPLILALEPFVTSVVAANHQDSTIAVTKRIWPSIGGLWEAIVRGAYSAARHLHEPLARKKEK